MLAALGKPVKKIQLVPGILRLRYAEGGKNGQAKPAIVIWKIETVISAVVDVMVRHILKESTKCYM